MTPTPEQVEAWAREAGADALDVARTGRGLLSVSVDGIDLTEELMKFAALACAWQREADAKIVEEHNPGGSYGIRTALAEAIRSDCAEGAKGG